MLKLGKFWDILVAFRDENTGSFIQLRVTEQPPPGGYYVPPPDAGVASPCPLRVLKRRRPCCCVLQPASRISALPSAPGLADARALPSPAPVGAAYVHGSSCS